jgi:glycosyltransferase involved in cell wall biosynthesis
VLIRELAEETAKVGHKVHVVTYASAQHLSAVKRIRIHRLPRLPGLTTPRPLGWQKPILDLLLVFLLARTVRAERIDVIHGHNIEGAIVAWLVSRMMGVRFVYHAHSSLEDELPRYFRRRWATRAAELFGRSLDRFAARAADFTLAVTDRLAAFLAARGAAGRIAALPSGVSLIRGDALPLGPRRKNPLIMYAGNLDPYQSLGLLVEAFRLVRACHADARLLIVTHPPMHAAVTARAAALAEEPGISVEVVPGFAGALRRLSEGDVLVCPRTSWSGFPVKVLNYLQLGRPIVFSEGSTGMFPAERVGVVTPNGSASEMAAAIVGLLENPDRWRELCEGARRTAAEFAWSRLLTRYLAVYGRVLGGSRGEELVGNLEG